MKIFYVEDELYPVYYISKDPHKHREEAKVPEKIVAAYLKAQKDFNKCLNELEQCVRGNDDAK